MTRRITERVIAATLLAGSSDSAAAMVAISAPPTAKITVGTAANTDIAPNGRKPRCAVRFATALPVWPKPNTYDAPIAMKTMIAATLIDANQNSNSPYDFTESRLITRHDRQQHEADHPDRRGNPALQDRRAGHRLDGHDDHPEVPVEPAAREARPVAEADARIFGEGADARHRERHFAEHAHDHQHDDARDEIRHARGRADRS